MTLVKPGRPCKPGDLLVEFDRQEQIRNALDRRAELNDFDQQIRKRQARRRRRQGDRRQHADAGRERRVERAQLEMREERDAARRSRPRRTRWPSRRREAKLKQLQETYDLKRQAAAADIKVLEIRRDRSRNEHEAGRVERRAHADQVAASPGVAVIKTTWKNGGNMVEIQEGDEVRPGVSRSSTS